MRNCKSLLVFSKYILLAALTTALPVRAVVNVDQTRIVFASDSLAQAIALSNDAKTPTIVQVWVDDGDVHSTPDKNNTPIIVLPPVFKMSPQEIRSLRVLLTSRNNLVKGKESLYWLNIYQIPSLNAEQKKADKKIILPLRLRIKVFVRPEGLEAPKPVDQQKLTFSSQGGQLTVDNPTPWFMSMSINAGIENFSDVLAPPMGKVTLPAKSGDLAGRKITYKIIDDRGNNVFYNAEVAAGH